MPGAGLKVPPPAGGRGTGTRRGSRLLCPLQVLEVGDTVAATDLPQMKLNVIGRGRIENAKQELSQLFTAGAGQAVASPDHPNAVQPRVLASDHHDQPLAQTRVAAQLSLELSHLSDRQRLF